MCSFYPIAIKILFTEIIFYNDFFKLVLARSANKYVKFSSSITLICQSYIDYVWSSTVIWSYMIMLDLEVSFIEISVKMIQFQQNCWKFFEISLKFSQLTYWKIAEICCWTAKILLKMNFSVKSRWNWNFSTEIFLKC